MSLQDLPPTDLGAAVECPACGWRGTFGDCVWRFLDLVRCPECGEAVELSAVAQDVKNRPPTSSPRTP